MGYTLELGLAEKVRQHPSGYVFVDGFTPLRVKSFTGGSTIPVDPELGYINLALDVQPYEYGDELFGQPTEFPTPRAIDDDGLVEASIDVTINYSKRIREITDIHLTDLHGERAAEVAHHFMRLIAELGDDPDFGDYWHATDGNIKHLAKTLLDWTFQHPDGLFYSLG